MSSTSVLGAFSLMRSSRSSPLIPGSTMSSSATSGENCSKISRPSSAELAVRTSQSFSSSTICRMYVRVLSSSTTRMRLFLAVAPSGIRMGAVDMSDSPTYLLFLK